MSTGITFVIVGRHRDVQNGRESKPSPE
jgi:hypothetical protein